MGQLKERFQSCFFNYFTPLVSPTQFAWSFRKFRGKPMGPLVSPTQTVWSFRKNKIRGTPNGGIGFPHTNRVELPQNEAIGAIDVPPNTRPVWCFRTCMWRSNGASVFPPHNPRGATAHLAVHHPCTQGADTGLCSRKRLLTACSCIHIGP